MTAVAMTLGFVLSMGCGIAGGLLLVSRRSKMSLSEQVALWERARARSRLTRTHGADVVAFQTVGVHEPSEWEGALRRGWTAERVVAIRDAWLEGLLRVKTFDGHRSMAGLEHIRKVVLTLSVDAYDALVDDPGLWERSPSESQEWFEAFGPAAPAVIAAGLALGEAVALRDAGALDGDGLRVLAALRREEGEG